MLARAAAVVREAVSPGSTLRRPLGHTRRGSMMAYRRATSTARMLPTFLEIAAQQSGTTSLHEYLGEHPHVGRPTTKEIHYFTHNSFRSLAWYRARFPRAGRFTHAFESTPYTLFHPCCPGRVQAALPEVKLVVLLRDPVDRAHSHYNHQVATGCEALEFEAALSCEAQRLAGEEERLRDDPRYSSFAHQHYSYLARGMYAEQLERWYACFAAERLLVLAAEELFAQPARTVHRVQSWLGLPEHTPSTLVARNARRYGSMDPQLRTRLRTLFAADAGRLRGLTGVQMPWA
ncbi:MAG: sulfotransferase domain-containing protein [Solirubrobacteraceae bacterium]